MFDPLYVSGENNIFKDRTCKTATQVETKLYDIPQILLYNSRIYELRGVLNFRQGQSSLRKSGGHYCAYAKREYRNWQKFDDLKQKAIPIKDSQMISCGVLL